MKIITRAEAKEKGLRRYFTGITCKYGHISERSVARTNCIECRRLETLKNSLKIKNNNLKSNLKYNMIYFCRLKKG